MANAYYLRCTRDYEIVTPASPVILTRFDGVRIETGQVLPESRFSRKAGDTYKARRKVEAESMIRTGNWTWDEPTIK